MRLHDQHRAIQDACALLRWFSDDDMADVQRTDGHSGPGWYAWSWEYPEEGSAFLGTNREIVAIAKCIVAHELKAVAT